MLFSVSHLSEFDAMTAFRGAPAYQILPLERWYQQQHLLPSFLRCGWAINIVDFAPVACVQPSCVHVTALTTMSMLAHFEWVSQYSGAPTILSVSRSCPMFLVVYLHSKYLDWLRCFYHALHLECVLCYIQAGHELLRDWLYPPSINSARACDQVDREDPQYAQHFQCYAAYSA